MPLASRTTVIGPWRRSSNRSAQAVYVGDPERLEGHFRQAHGVARAIDDLAHAAIVGAKDHGIREEDALQARTEQPLTDGLLIESRVSINFTSRYSV